MLNRKLRLDRLLDPLRHSQLAKTTAVGTNKNKIAHTLLAHIDVEQLPKEFGGNAEGFTWPESKTSCQ